MSGFVGILTAVFVGLKLAGVIQWSWWLVLAPMWGSLVLAVLLAIIIAAATE